MNNLALLSIGSCLEKHHLQGVYFFFTNVRMCKDFNVCIFHLQILLEKTC